MSNNLIYLTDYVGDLFERLLVDRLIIIGISEKTLDTKSRKFPGLNIVIPNLLVIHFKTTEPRTVGNTLEALRRGDSFLAINNPRLKHEYIFDREFVHKVDAVGFALLKKLKN